MELVKIIMQRFYNLSLPYTENKSGYEQFSSLAFVLLSLSVAWKIPPNL